MFSYEMKTEYHLVKTQVYSSRGPVEEESYFLISSTVI